MVPPVARMTTLGLSAKAGSHVSCQLIQVADVFYRHDFARIFFRDGSALPESRFVGLFLSRFSVARRSVNAAPAAIRAWPVARSQSFSSLIGAMMQRRSGGIEPAFPAEKWGLR
jgi:hypothetical protein